VHASRKKLNPGTVRVMPILRPDIATCQCIERGFHFLPYSPSAAISLPDCNEACPVHVSPLNPLTVSGCGVPPINWLSHRRHPII
jgi:hypothetical protein